jgi:hypothetical protein
MFKKIKNDMNPAELSTANNQTQILELAKWIKENLDSSTSSTKYASLLYYKMYVKSTLLKKLYVSDAQIINYINKPLSNGGSWKFETIDEVKESINSFISFFGLKNPRIKKVIKRNYISLGLFEIFKENKKDINRLIEKINDIENLTIVDCFTLYELLDDNKLDYKALNRLGNTYPIVYDISNTLVELSISNNQIKSIIEKEEKLTVYDPNCEIGQLLYSNYEKLRVKYPNLNIELFGVFNSKREAVFAQSILDIVNYNKSYIVIGNALIAKPFGNKKFDLIISKPPFGKIADKDYVLIEKLASGKCNKAEYKKIVNNFQYVNAA